MGCWDEAQSPSLNWPGSHALTSHSLEKKCDDKCSRLINWVANHGTQCESCKKLNTSLANARGTRNPPVQKHFLHSENIRVINTCGNRIRAQIMAIGIN